MIERYKEGVRIASQSLHDLAEHYGTPALFLDESAIRSACRRVTSALAAAPPGSRPLFASKALDLAAICRLCHDEGLDIDVVSAGELYTALQAGVPASSLWLHGNAKTDAEIAYAVEQGLGRIVLDSIEDVRRVASAAQAAGVRQTVLLRLSLGVEPETHAYMQTGQIDSKFGFALDEARAMVRIVMAEPHLHLTGFHSHIGSQILTPRPFLEAAVMMMDFLQRVHADSGFWPEDLNLGGGFGIAYVPSETTLDLLSVVPTMVETIKERSAAIGQQPPRVFIEPGRAIVGEAGVTVYRIISLKGISNVRTYVAVDGGMGDNLRPALYQAHYEGALVDRPLDPPTGSYRVVGRYCESGDVLIEQCPLPRPAAGDLLVVFDTGAYCYPMATTYNRVPRPPVVLVSEQGSEIIARRETLEDLLRLDVLPERWLQAAHHRT